MTYAAELDDGPREFRRGFASNVLHFWPKVPGIGNVLADSATCSLYKPDGTLIASPSVTLTTIGGVTRFDVTVDMSNTTTYQLAEGYRADITWAYGGDTYLDGPRFSACTAPYRPHISLNDLVEELADCEQILTGQAQALADLRTAEQHASVLGVKAWADVYQALQARIRADGQIAPRLILEQWKINPVIRAKALELMFRAEGGTGRSRELAEDWKREVERRLLLVGELTYDSDDDQVMDSTAANPVSVSCRRAW